MNESDLEAWLTRHNIGEVSCVVADFSGAARGKYMTPASFLSADRQKSLRIPETTYAINVHGKFTSNQHVDQVEQDLVLVCDLETVHVTPWAKDETACVICDGYRIDGTPSPIAPRQVLKNIVELYRERGLEPIVGPEVEFYLIRKFEDFVMELKPPRGASGLLEFGQHTYSLDAIDEFDDFFEDLYDFAEAQGIEIDTIIHEDGPCQFEINLKHGDALKIADHLFMFKRLARQVAKRHDIFITFMAKPYAEMSGSSMHLHQSVVDRDTGKNVFSDEDGSDSEMFSHYIGGLQEHLPSAMPLIAPYTNSYNRFAAYMSAPTNVHWGRENRTVGLRVPESIPAARRVENRIAGSDTNPYLVIATSLACGYIGLDQAIPRKEEFIGQSAKSLSRVLPKTLTEALAKFRNSKELRRIIGDPMVDTFADVKQSEYDHRSSVLSPWDVNYLLVNV